MGRCRPHVARIARLQHVGRIPPNEHWDRPNQWRHPSAGLAWPAVSWPSPAVRRPSAPQEKEKLGGQDVSPAREKENLPARSDSRGRKKNPEALSASTAPEKQNPEAPGLSTPQEKPPPDPKEPPASQEKRSPEPSRRSSAQEIPFPEARPHPTTRAKPRSEPLTRSLYCHQLRPNKAPKRFGGSKVILEVTAFILACFHPFHE